MSTETPPFYDIGMSVFFLTINTFTLSLKIA